MLAVTDYAGLLGETGRRSSPIVAASTASTFISSAFYDTMRIRSIKSPINSRVGFNDYVEIEGN